MTSLWLVIKTKSRTWFSGFQSSNLSQLAVLDTIIINIDGASTVWERLRHIDLVSNRGITMRLRKQKISIVRLAVI